MYLRKAETLFAIGLPAAAIFYWLRKEESVDWIVRAPGLLLVSYLLLQGALYWHFKLRDVQLRCGFPAVFGTLFRTFRWSNPVLLAACAAFAASRAPQGADLAWIAGLLGFALLEHVNYYHWQLMYDTPGAWAALRRNRRLRRAALATDLA